MPLTEEMIRAQTIVELNQAISKALQKAEILEQPPDLSGNTVVYGSDGQDCSIEVYPGGSFSIKPYEMCDLS